MGFWQQVVQLWNGFSPEYRLYIIVILAVIPLTVAGIVAGYRVNAVFRRYSSTTAECGLTAAEVARRMLDSNDCRHVTVTRGRGHLTDCYDPRTQTITLSESVYGSRSVAAIGVACHEAGHAVQHARKFVFATVRLKLVPAVNFANRLFFPILLIGMIFGFASPYSLLGTVLIWIGVGVFGLSMLFSLVTLPTEFDASRRAQAALKSEFFSSQEAAASRKVLRAAAMTYVVAFLLSLVQFLRFLALLLLSRRRD